VTALPDPMLLPRILPASGDYWREPAHIRVQTKVKAWFGLFTIHGSFRIKDCAFPVAEDPRGSTVRASIQGAGYGSGNIKLNQDVTAATLLDAAGDPQDLVHQPTASSVREKWPMKGVVNCHGAPEPVEVSASHASLERRGAMFKATAQLDHIHLAVTNRGGLVGPGVELVIDAFAHRLREDGDLEVVGSEFVRAVQASVEPARVSLWLRPTGSSR
jgi:polyisoprenoid-binding protein YceI